jgi:hypothetical protein
MQQVMKGWLIFTSPEARPGDSTAWFASFWEFCALYCNERFGDGWHLSPEQSLLLQAENTVVPPQAIIYSRKGHNNTVKLPFGTSLYDLKEQQLPPRNHLVNRNGLRIFSPTAALVRVPESFFARNPIENQVVLTSIRDASELLRQLLDGGHSAIAGRLVGALRRVGREELAEEILSTMKTAGYDVRETDPFAVSGPRSDGTRRRGRHDRAAPVPAHRRSDCQLLRASYGGDRYGYSVRHSGLSIGAYSCDEPKSHPADCDGQPVMRNVEA